MVLYKANNMHYDKNASSLSSRRVVAVSQQNNNIAFNTVVQHINDLLDMSYDSSEKPKTKQQPRSIVSTTSHVVSHPGPGAYDPIRIRKAIPNVLMQPFRTTAPRKMYSKCISEQNSSLSVDNNPVVKLRQPGRVNMAKMACRYCCQTICHCAQAKPMAVLGSCTEEKVDKMHWDKKQQKPMDQTNLNFDFKHDDASDAKEESKYDDDRFTAMDKKTAKELYFEQDSKSAFLFHKRKREKKNSSTSAHVQNISVFAPFTKKRIRGTKLYPKKVGMHARNNFAIHKMRLQKSLPFRIGFYTCGHTLVEPRMKGVPLFGSKKKPTVHLQKALRAYYNPVSKLSDCSFQQHEDWNVRHVKHILPFAPRKKTASNVTTVTDDKTWYPTQAHAPWLDENVEKDLVQEMKRQSGRDVVKVHGKSNISITSFLQPPRQHSDLGPGAYTHEEGTLGYTALHPRGLFMDTLIGRNAIRGPHGERPDDACDQDEGNTLHLKVDDDAILYPRLRGFVMSAPTDIIEEDTETRRLDLQPDYDFGKKESTVGHRYLSFAAQPGRHEDRDEEKSDEKVLDLKVQFTFVEPRVPSFSMTRNARYDNYHLELSHKNDLLDLNPQYELGWGAASGVDMKKTSERWVEETVDLYLMQDHGLLYHDATYVLEKAHQVLSTYDQKGSNGLIPMSTTLRIPRFEKLSTSSALEYELSYASTKKRMPQLVEMNKEQERFLNREEQEPEGRALQLEVNQDSQSTKKRIPNMVHMAIDLKKRFLFRNYYLMESQHFTDHAYLLQQVRESFQDNIGHSESVSDIHLPEMLSIMTVQKTKNHEKQRQRLVHKFNKRKELLKHEMLLKGKMVTHNKEWNLSTNSNRLTRPPHSIEMEEPLSVITVPSTSKSFNTNPWLPTCLLPHLFGPPNMDTLSKEYIHILTMDLQFHMKKCQHEMESLQSNTQEGLALKAACSQAIRQYSDMLETLSRE